MINPALKVDQRIYKDMNSDFDTELKKSSHGLKLSMDQHH